MYIILRVTFRASLNGDCMDLVPLLRELSATPGVAGYEQAIRAVIEARLRPLVDEVHTDALGTLIGLKRGTGARADPRPSPLPEGEGSRGASPRLMLAAH